MGLASQQGLILLVSLLLLHVGASSSRQELPDRHPQRQRRRLAQGTASFVDLLEVSAEFQGAYWRMPAGDAVSETRARRSAVLVAVPTANVWPMTHALLTSLAHVDDDFDLLFMDDLSADNTDEKLAARNIYYLQPPRFLGLTYLWNMAYAFWRRHGYTYLFISNNDVLIPNGVINRMVKAMPPDPPILHTDDSCDLISPMSTKVGKGFWGPQEGIEVLYNLSDAQARFVNNSMNYARVQAFLDASADADAVVRNRHEFSGFFFGVNSNIVKIEYNETTLFWPGNHVIGQEWHMSPILRDAGLKMCLHRGAFVYHFKGSTVPTNIPQRLRRAFRHATKLDVLPE